MIKKVLTTFLTFSVVAVATWYLLPYVKDTEYALPKFFIVESGSMEPAIKTGSVVVSVPQRSYQINDIVTFRYGNNDKQPVTHRIEVRKFDASGAAIYQTSGDANKTFDPLEITDANIIGKVVLSIPYLGYVANFAKTLKGFIFLIIIPATIIIYEELKIVWREVDAKLGKKKLQTKESQIEVQKAAVVLPFIGVLFLTSSISSSFFVDRESVLGNLIRVEIPATPPVSSSQNLAANHLVVNEIMFNPDNPTCGSEPNAEWIEIYNPTLSNVSLNSWSVADNTSSDLLPDVVLQAGKFAVVTNCDQADFLASWTVPTDAVFIDLGSSIGNGLANGGDEVKLLDSLANLVDHVSYGTNTNAFSPAVIIPVSNHTIERNPKGIDTDAAVDFIDQSVPSPGN